MNNLLKAMGFWVWGLIAIGLSVSMVSVTYKMISLYRAHDIKADAASVPVGSPPSTLSMSAQKPAPAPPVDAQGLQPAEPMISRVIAKEIKAAQKALYSGQWSEALRDVDAASTKSPHSAYDLKTIDEFRGVAYVRLGNFKAAQTAYEAALATRAYKEEELVKVFRLLFQLAATNKQDTKAIEYGKQTAEAGAATDNDLVIMTQLYYQQKDCKNSAAWGDKAVAAFKKAGEAPKEVLYQLKLQCAIDANDTAGMKAALYDLVRLTNKTSYWNNLIRLERQDARDDHDTLMIYRVMYDTNSMNADTDYIEMAQLLGDAGLPGEAQTVLQKAMRAGLIKDEHRERVARLLSAVKARADQQRADTAELLRASQISSAGSFAADVRAQDEDSPAGREIKLGERYYGLGDYSAAVTAIMNGIENSAVSMHDEGYVYIGRSLMAQKNPIDAKMAFSQLKPEPGISPRVLKLWSLYAETIPSAGSASL
jgi:tetratricopeptide (TPR) repeat protein